MNFDDRTYQNIVRDQLTVLTGGTIQETHSIGTVVPDLIHLDHRPVKRISFLQGEILLGTETKQYRFTERDFELVGTEQNPDDFSAIRFRDRGRKPAPNSQLTVNYYPLRLKPTPITDINVGSVARTMIETISREIATQYVQLQRVYDSAFIETATGSSLDKVVALLDIKRLKQGHPIGKVRFSRRIGSAGSVFIPVSTAVSDGEGSRYVTSHEATLLPNQASVEVWVHGEYTRTSVVDTATLVVLERAIAGIDRVINDEPTYRSTEEETDEQLAGRTRKAIHGTGKGTGDAIRFGLEGLSFVSAATLTEYPDPSVQLPGILRVDVALTDDTEYNKRLVDRRIKELRPAGIYIDRHWAGSVTIGFTVNLILAGSTLPVSTVADIKNSLTQRLSTYVKTLGPSASLRKAKVISLVMQDDQIADAVIEITADSTPVTTDVWTLPTGVAAKVDSVNPVSFGPIQYEEDGDADQFSFVYVDGTLSVSEPAVSGASLEETVQTKLESYFAALNPGDSITFDQLATTIRDDDSFALIRADSLFLFDQEGGGFTEVSEDGVSYVVPKNVTISVRDITIGEENA